MSYPSASPTNNSNNNSSLARVASSTKRVPQHLSAIASLGVPPPAFSAQAQHFLFTCQSCKKSIQIDPEKPIPESVVSAFNQTFYNGAANAGTATPSGPSALDLLSESFVLLPANKLATAFAPPSGGGGSSVSGPSASGSGKTSVSSTNFDRQVQAASKLFDVVRGVCPVNAPLCTSCHTSLLTEFDRRQIEMERETEEYRRIIHVMESQELAAEAAASHVNPNNAGNTNNAAADLSEEEAALDAEERALSAELNSLRKEKQGLHDEYASLQEETQKLSEFETEFWKEYEVYSLELQQLNEEQLFLKNQISYLNDTLEFLKRTNVFDDAFHISHDGHFPTINGFRLGRLPSQPVDWSETSAGLGQVILLLHTLARNCSYSFTQYRLLPMGSYSKMAKLDDLSTTYELYGSNDLILGRLFWYRRFDTALVWLLACIQEFGDYAKSLDSRFVLKYPIRGDLIGDVSIKLQFNNDARWTKALKYMLTNLKFLLAWCVQRKQNEGAGASSAATNTK